MYRADLLVMHTGRANKIYAYVNQYAFFETNARDVYMTFLWR